MDTVSKDIRSYVMSRVRSSGTKVEELLRKAVWRSGMKYRKTTKLPGKPDMIFSDKKLAVFVDGCFWHKCPTCYRQPHSNLEYWIPKANKNVVRDKQVTYELKKQGWKVLRVWEHEVYKNVSECTTKVKRAYTSRAKRAKSYGTR